MDAGGVAVLGMVVCALLGALATFVAIIVAAWRHAGDNRARRELQQREAMQRAQSQVEAHQRELTSLTALLNEIGANKVALDPPRWLDLAEGEKLVWIGRVFTLEEGRSSGADGDGTLYVTTQRFVVAAESGGAPLRIPYAKVVRARDQPGALALDLDWQTRPRVVFHASHAAAWFLYQTFLMLARQ